MNKTKFFLDKNNTSELNTFFEKLRGINLKLKKKTTTKITSHKNKNVLRIYGKMITIIKEVDNGSTVVILHKTYYKTKIPEILKDETSYKLIDKDIDNNII